MRLDSSFQKSIEFYVEAMGQAIEIEVDCDSDSNSYRHAYTIGQAKDLKNHYPQFDDMSVSEIIQLLTSLEGEAKEWVEENL